MRIDLNDQVIGWDISLQATLSRAEQLAGPELTYPLRVLICTQCWLVQLPVFVAADALHPDYAYFPAFQAAGAHAERFVAAAVKRLDLGVQSYVVELPPTMATCCSTCRSVGFLAWVLTHHAAQAARAKEFPLWSVFWVGVSRIA